MDELEIGTNGVRLHVMAEGPPDGPLVVLLHGFPEFWYSWRKQMPVLAAAGWRVVAPDKRGYNCSDKPWRVAEYKLARLVQDIVGLIKELGREEAVVVGHDWGGAVAHGLAIRFPRLTKKLVVLNSPHPAVMWRDLKKPRQLIRSYYIFLLQVPWLPEHIYNFAARLWDRLGLWGRATDKDVFTSADLQAYARATTRPGAMRSMINWYRAAGRYGTGRQFSRRVTVPARVIWGMDDFALGPWMTEGLEPYYGSDFAVHRIPHCGHWVQNEAPDVVNRLLLDFLNR